MVRYQAALRPDFVEPSYTLRTFMQQTRVVTTHQKSHVSPSHNRLPVMLGTKPIIRGFGVLLDPAEEFFQFANGLVDQLLVRGHLLLRRFALESLTGATNSKSLLIE